MAGEIYKRYPVATQLAPFVRRIMVADCSLPVDFRVRPGPTGYNYLGWIYSGFADLTVDGQTSREVAGDHLHTAGQIRYQEIEVRYQGVMGHISVEFTGAGFYELLPMTGADVHGKLQALDPAEHLWTANFVDAAAALPSDTGPEARCALLESFLLSLVPNARAAPAYVRTAIKMIEDSGGLVTMGDVVAEAGTSPRQLRRAFLEVTGVSPKYFGRVIQVNQMLEIWMSGDERRLTDLAQAAGYYDQAHFNKTIGQFFSASPQSFLDSETDVLFEFLGRRLEPRFS